MARRVVTPEQFLDLAFPLAGYADDAEYARQRPLTTRRGVNVRGEEPRGQMLRGGMRMGLTRFIDDRVSGDNPIYHLNVVVDPQAPRLWAYAPEETDRPLGGTLDDAIPDPSTNNDADGRGPRTTGNVRRGGNGVQKKRPLPGCTITTRLFEFDPIFIELLLACSVQSCVEAGMGADPLNVAIQYDGATYYFDWTGGGLPTEAFVNTSIATLSGNSLTYCTGYSDTNP